MKKKLTAITLATTIVMGSSFFGNYSYAEAATKDLTNIQNQRNDIKENVSQTEREISNVVSEIESMNHEIERVQQILIEKEAVIEQTNQDIEETTKEINILQEELIELEKSIEKRFEILRNRASSYQQTGGSVNYLEVIFGSANFSDFISRVSMVNKIADADATLMEQIEQDMVIVEEKQQLSMTKLDELNAMKAEQEAAVLVMKEQKEKNEQSRQALEKKQSELRSLINELKQKDNNLASLEEEVKQSIAAVEKKAKQNIRETSSQTKSAKTTTAKPQKQSNVQEKARTKSRSKQSNTFTVTATAYTVQSAGGSGKTYTGIDLRKNPNSKVIAVDPSVIPLGSVVHVEGYGYAIAGDIGSAIKGNKIDVYVPTQKQAVNWGVRKVKVTVQ